FGRATFQRVSRAAALGADPAAQDDVRRSIESLIAEGERPANVDENGEIHDVEVPGPPAPEFGDPDTDDYQLEEAV
ncbi:hypothetical protein N864_12300, partial [Intrasporangium chromatireducens Q5-1]